MYANVNAAPMVAGANVNAAPMVAGAYDNVAPTMVAPAYGYGYPVQDYGYDNTFVLIVVLFILLIIVGACFYPKC